MGTLSFEYISDDDFEEHLKSLQCQPQPLQKAQVSVNGGMFIDGKYFGQCKFNGKILTVDPYISLNKIDFQCMRIYAFSKNNLN